MTVVSLSVGLFNEVKAYFSLNEDTYYTCTIPGGYKIRAYKLKTTDPNKKECSVAWFWSEDENHPNPIPSTLPIPEEVALDDGNYKVVSIYKGGFRSCTFQSIELPQTIEEIREEAFAYCVNMTSFTIPHSITKIAPSTFLDCKALELFYYTGYENENDDESEIIKKLGNSMITEIGDHAFDNCVSLKGLYLPSSLVTIGNSAFQRCKLLQSIYFPSEKADKSNKITVGSYAFADCPLLKTVYFEENMDYIGEYAFANCKEDLTFAYTGSDEPTTFAEHWRDKNITTSNDYVYPFLEYGQPKVHIDDEYPGLIYSYETNDQFLNCAGPNRPTVKVIENSEEYAIINSFQEPFTSQPGYYDVDHKILTVPNFIHGRVVKSIGQNAFAGIPLRKVIFNKDLVQIQNRAFYNCNNIDTLNFTACEHLREVSYEVFQSPCPELFSDKEPTVYANDQKYNEVCHSLALPNSLEYIGDSAFYNFTQLTGGITFNAHNPSKPSNLKMIGNFSFSVYRNKSVSHGASELIDLVLPNSLDDRYATGFDFDDEEKEDIIAANFYHPFDPIWNNERDPKFYRYAVGRFAFENQDIIATVTMEEATSKQAADNYHTTSFMSNGFVRCNNLVKFKSNKNLYMIGQDTFKLCPNIKELFLYSEKAQWQFQNNNGAKFPWGISDIKPIPGDASSYGMGIFAVGNSGNGNSNSHPDTVVYVSGSSAPGWNDDPSKYNAGTYKWNVDETETLKTGLEYGKNAGQISNKKEVPVFYNVNWEGDDINLLYWKPGNNNSGTFRPFTDANNANYEYTLSYSEYNLGYIPIVPVETRTEGDVQVKKYAVVHYFTNGANGNVQNEIDLTNINTAHGDISNNLIRIAGCAFAKEGGKNAGLYFILPTSIESIGERAFFRMGGNSSSVRIVTYKSGGTAQVPSGETRTYATIKGSYSTDTGGYCMLPSKITKIEPNCFFNHNFKTIVLNTTLAHFGASAFASNNFVDRTTELQYTKPTTDALFEAVNGGLYYIKDSTKKTLVYQVGGTTDGTLTIQAGTKAVAFRAAVHSNYSKITIPNGLTTIYGGAFINSQVKTIDGDLSTLKYISALALSGDSEVYSSYSGANALPFDNYDVTSLNKRAADWATYVEYGRHGAFKGCSQLTTINFTEMTSLKSIGPDAFSGCTALTTVTPKPYTVYSYVSKGSGAAADLLTADQFKVLDLSDCVNLQNIGMKAFANVNTFTYTILPNTVGTSTSIKANIKIGNDASTLPPSSLRLIGDTYHQASIDFGSSSLSRSTYYPNNAMRGKDQYNFYRFFVPTEMPADKTIDDYLAHTGDANKYQALQYWTIYNGKYYLLKGYNQTKAFFNAIANGTYTTAGQALTY